MLHDPVRQIELRKSPGERGTSSRPEAVWYGMDTHVVCVLNESPARLAPTGVPAHGDVGLEIWDVPRRAILCLLGDRAEEELERLNESLLRALRTSRRKPAPEAVKGTCQRKRPGEGAIGHA